MRFLTQVKKDRKSIHWGKDIFAGIVVALVSIPIAMGYAQIAGLPAVYGLYGSLLPILLFGLVTSSPQFVVGVDAMPAVMVGASLSSMGLVLGGEEAVALIWEEAKDPEAARRREGESDRAYAARTSSLPRVTRILIFRRPA